MNNLKNLSDFVIDQANEEFNGPTYNAHSFIDTLSKLDEKSASDTNTFEGYCAWELAHHICYCKILVLRKLNELFEDPDKSAHMIGIEPIPFEFRDFAPAPMDRPVGSWKKFLEYLKVVHDNCLKAIKSLTPEMLAMDMPEWKTTYGKIVAWFFTHDTYHNAQIRNMGIPALKEKKVGT